MASEDAIWPGDAQENKDHKVFVEHEEYLLRKGMMNEPIHQLFANLDSWRHLPSYQLARRADIIFSVYLPEYLKKKYGYHVQVVIPDFPIRVGTVRPLTDNNSSFKIDYFVKVSNPSMVILLKFMMERKSKGLEPDWYLAEAKKKGVRQLLIGLEKLVAGSTPKNRFDFSPSKP
jgi:hypothetical protein